MSGALLPATGNVRRVLFDGRSAQMITPSSCNFWPFRGVGAVHLVDRLSDFCSCFPLKRSRICCQVTYNLAAPTATALLVGRGLAAPSPPASGLGSDMLAPSPKTSPPLSALRATRTVGLHKGNHFNSTQLAITDASVKHP